MVPANANNNAAPPDVEDGVPDIQQTFNALFQRLCDDASSTPESVEVLIVEWRRKYLAGVDDPRARLFFDAILPAMVARHVHLEQNRRVAQKKTVFWTVMLTVFDTLSDYSAFVVLRMAGSVYATPMLVVLVVSMSFQAITTHFHTKEGPIATIGALLGFKPIIDGINICFDIQPRPGALTSLQAFGYTRIGETATESIPFAIMQSLALMEHQSVSQWISFAISLASVAHAVASVDYQIDTSMLYRKLEPLCYGMYPPGAKGDGLFAAFAICALSYAMAKLVAVAVLGNASGALLALAFVSESIVFLLARFTLGNWRFYSPAGDSTTFSLVIHFFCMHPIMVAAPFPALRHPFFLSPLLYAAFLVWTLFALNPLMVILAFRHRP